MCGICGFVAPKATKEWKHNLLYDLLSASQSRGSDATGVAFVERGKMQVIKDGVKAEDFIVTEEFAALKPRLPSIVIGHTRGASRSANNIASPSENENNHPFFSPATGLAIIHNGLLDDDMWRDTVGKEHGLLQEFEGHCDSEAWLRVGETVRLKYPDQPMLITIEDTCFNVSGKYTIGMISENHPTSLWLVKHDNPLHVALLPKEKAIVFASEESILKSALLKYKTHLNFFNQSFLPEGLVINEVPGDYALEINIDAEHRDMFRLAGKQITPATSTYDFHKKAAEMLEKEEEIPAEALV
jgi:glucosamine 6-phosphate synthetase-like amidotransferase/phosphosugar isomerase protein